VLVIKGSLLSTIPREPSLNTALINALIYVNFVLTDGVVVWRALIICRDSVRLKRVIYVSLVFLTFTSLFVVLIIALRISTIALGLNSNASQRLSDIINVTQIVASGFSLLTNLFSTSAIWLKAWSYRRTLRGPATDSKRTKVERILKLLVESGLIYIASGIIALASTLVHLPVGTLGDLYLPIHVQIAGIYPTAVLMLVSQERSIGETAISAGVPTAAVPRLSTMEFGANTVHPPTILAMPMNGSVNDSTQSDTMQSGDKDESIGG